MIWWYYSPWNNRSWRQPLLRVCVCALGLKSLGRSSCTCNSNTACAIVRDPWILSFWSHWILEATFGNWLASRWSNQLLKNSGYSSIFLLLFFWPLLWTLWYARLPGTCKHAQQGSPHSLSLVFSLPVCLSLSLSLIIFGCIISKTNRSQNHIPYRQLPTLVIFRLFHFVLFCLNRLHPCEKCTASEPAGTRPEPVANVPGAKPPARIVKSVLPRNPLEPVRNPW